MVEPALHGEIFRKGDEVVVFGKLQSLKPRTMDHPETEVVEAGEERFIHFNRITPVYPLTEGLPQRWLRGLIWRTLATRGANCRAVAGPAQVASCRLQAAGSGSQGDGAGNLQPATRHRQPTFPTRARAIHLLHFPETMEDIDLARRRLALDEFIELQRQIQLRRKNSKPSAQRCRCGGDNHLIKPFLARLGFKLTAAQTKCCASYAKICPARTRCAGCCRATSARAKRWWQPAAP